MNVRMCEKCGQVMTFALSSYIDGDHPIYADATPDICTHCGTQQGSVSATAYAEFNAHVQVYEDLCEKNAAIPSWLGFWFGLLLWPVCFFSSALMFDAPRSASSIPTKIAAFSLWTYPIFHLTAIVRSKLVASSGGSLRAVRNWANLRWVNIVSFILAVAWMMLFCGGSFVC